jgi:predicted HTH domain antitoxin
VKSIFVKEKYMRTIQLTIPDEIELKEFDFTMIVATKLYEDGLLSAGQAAQMTGLSKRAFIEILGKYGVSVFSSSVDDLYLDIANA